MKITAKHVLFIDANLYLDLYERDQVAVLLQLLESARGYVFVTEQIRDEVERNRTKIQSRFLHAKLAKVKSEQSFLPDIMKLSQVQSRELGSSKENLKSVEKEIEDHIVEVNNGTDDVSVLLSSVFLKARKASSEQISRARLRKELGNPPGKQGDCLGDQISWIQLIDCLRDAKDVWILTKDSDYGLPVSNSNAFLLNPFLLNELKNRNLTLKINTCKELFSGLKGFLKAVEEAKLKSINKLQLELAEQEEHFLQMYESALERAAQSTAASILLDAQSNFYDMHTEVMKSIGQSLRVAGPPNPILKPRKASGAQRELSQPPRRDGGT